MATSAFVGAGLTDEPIPSGLAVTLRGFYEHIPQRKRPSNLATDGAFLSATLNTVSEQPCPCTNIYLAPGRSFQIASGHDKYIPRFFFEK
jgi:hypothetical protein